MKADTSIVQISTNLEGTRFVQTCTKTIDINFVPNDHHKDRRRRLCKYKYKKVDTSFLQTGTKTGDTRFVKKSTKTGDTGFAQTSIKTGDDSLAQTDKKTRDTSFAQTSTKTGDTSFVQTNTKTRDTGVSQTSTKRGDTGLEQTSTKTGDSSLTQTNKKTGNTSLSQTNKMTGETSCVLTSIVHREYKPCVEYYSRQQLCSDKYRIVQQKLVLIRQVFNNIADSSFVQTRTRVKLPIDKHSRQETGQDTIFVQTRTKTRVTSFVQVITKQAV